jgi:hypothetical protein
VRLNVFSWVHPSTRRGLLPHKTVENKMAAIDGANYTNVMFYYRNIELKVNGYFMVLHTTILVEIHHTKMAQKTSALREEAL